MVQEVYIERTSRRGLVSNLYKGRVSRVLPGMQAAFVEIGLERTAFLHAADIARSLSEDTQLGVAPLSEPAEDIRRLVNSGDDILVQVIKDPIGSKGARLTTFVSLPSRYLVYMPRGEAIGVSARIEDEAERARLKALVGELAGSGGAGGGYIVRTAAQGASAREPARGHELPGEAVGARAARASRRRRRARSCTRICRCRLRVLRDELVRGVSRVLVDSAARAGAHAAVRRRLPVRRARR